MCSEFVCYSFYHLVSIHSKRMKAFNCVKIVESWLDQKQLMITYSNLSYGSVKYYFPTFVELICFFSDQIDSVKGIYSFASAV